MVTISQNSKIQIAWQQKTVTMETVSKQPVD